MRLIEGLAFAVPLQDGRFGVGQLVKPQFPIWYMLGYDLALTDPPSIIPGSSLGTPVLAGNFFDVLLKNGRWRPLAVMPLPDTIPFPFFKVRIGDKVIVESWDLAKAREATSAEADQLCYRCNYSAMYLEDALKAHHSVIAWSADLEPLRIEQVARIATIVEPLIE